MANREQKLGHYLLGEMSDAERAELEREYFEDPLLFEQLVQAENELVDAYARGQLPPETRGRFERHYLTHPARRERAEFAVALGAALARRDASPDAPPARAEPLWRRLLAPAGGPKLVWAFSASLLLVAASAAWLFIGTGRQPDELARGGGERITQERGREETRRQAHEGAKGAAEPSRGPDASPAEQNKIQTSPTPAVKPAPVVATLLLTVAGTRGAEADPPEVLRLTARTEEVRLRLNLGDADYRGYSGVLRRAGGDEVFSWRRVTPRAAKAGQTISLVIPARRLTKGDYVLTLKGARQTGEAEDVSVSRFSVER